MLLPALMIAAGVAASDLPMDIVGGVRLGESEAAATDHMRQFGRVERQVGEGGAITLTADKVTVTICRSRVVHVDEQLGRSVHDFAHFAELFLKTHGTARSPDIFTLDYGSSASTKALVTSATLRLTWAKAPAFSLGYVETDGDGEVFEALNADNPCDQPPTGGSGRTQRQLE